MWQKIKGWFSSSIKGINDFLQAHPKVKNWLDGLEKAVIAAVLAYFGTILTNFQNGVPLTPDMSHGLLVGLLGGLFVVVSGAIKAYSQNLHDIILANTQDNVIASSQNVPLTNSSVLTPISAGPGPTGEEPRLATPGVPPPAPAPANRATAGPLKAYKPILREPPPKQ